MRDHPIYIRPIEEGDAPALLDLKQRNRSSFQPFEPIRDEAHFTLEGQQKEIAGCLSAMRQDQSYIYAICLAAGHKLIGRIALTGISRGPFQNAYMGYYIDQAYQGRGYATAAAALCARHAFSELGLHRVQAAVMPSNPASVRVLEKAGFRREGLAERYLRMNGVWEDHALYAMTSEERVLGMDGL
ncbi:GNAT family N-acetyltransferase [Paenibacillus soyae]|uniref:GNAT family N-acetyltransferase n=1 Tax=Paenibacillus soyae TaxID=2969249 RepID=A0A9X2MS84_9BACL|nr:GNAT family protein [Paenibacillus soyae]MCR2805869.1 GNAT family N-acetyltransferase [Paenibacillus soyae]